MRFRGGRWTRREAALVALGGFALGPPGCGRMRERSIFLDPALIPLLPGNTVILAGIRAMALRESPMYADLRERGAGVLDGLKEEYGFPEWAELLDVLVASTPADTAVLMRGKFSAMGLEPEIRREGYRRFGHSGYTFHGTEEEAIVFMNPSTALAGPTPLLRRVIDARNEAMDSPPVVEIARRDVPPESHVWGVVAGKGALLDRLIPSEGNLANMRRTLAYVQGFTFALDLKTGANLYLKSTAIGAQQAEELEQMLEGALNLWQALDAGRKAAPDQVEVTRNGTVVEVRAAIPPAALRALLESILPPRSAL